MIVLDENIDQELIELLESYNWQQTIFSIRKNSPGISDKEVIRKVRENEGILITEDKDFGELVFAHGFPNNGITVIFLKIEGMEIAQVEKILTKTLNQYMNTSINYFITIDKNKIRVTIL